MPATTSDVTTVSGVVKFNMNDGSVKKAGNNEVQIIALSAAGKIAGIAATDANGKYTIKDTVGGAVLTAGTYTLVARSAKAETYVATITLTDKQNLTQDIVMNEGADGSIKAKITNTNGNPIAGINVTAYDSYYVNTATASNWVKNAVGTVPVATLVGVYDDSDVKIHAGNTVSDTER